MKDYHSHEHEGERWVWDVRRLWRLSNGISARRVPIRSLSFNLAGSCWFTENPPLMDLVKHFRRVMSADLRYPIILSPDNYVMDGLHRLTKAIIRKHTHIWAVKFKELPDPDCTEPLMEEAHE